MRYITDSTILNLLEDARGVSRARIHEILTKAERLERLTLAESAVLLSVDDQILVEQILQSAARVKEAVYGRRVVLFAPLYISNWCVNTCAYCAFKADNKALTRRALTSDEITEQVRWLLERGHKRILMVCGESAPAGISNIDYYVQAMEAVYAAQIGPHRIKRVNANLAPLTVDEFRRLKKSGIGTYQLFQETYHDQTYRALHPRGPKSDPDNRLDAIERAFRAGIDDVGIGVLYGLYDWRFETLACLTHIEALERTFGVGPHTISVPRIEPACGVTFASGDSVSDETFKRIVAILRLSVPYTGIILSTRESPEMRDSLFSLGVSQISAESRTSPGGYGEILRQEKAAAQFSLNDYRSLDEVIGSLLDRGCIPSFCAACYRQGRTGEAFMRLARPGTIKGKCSLNALVTLKEYCDDFASDEVRKKGYALIEQMKPTLDSATQKELAAFFAAIDQGLRDAYV